MLSGRRDSMLVPSPTEPTRPTLPSHEQANGMNHLGGLISLSSETASLMTRELSEYLGANMRIPPEVLESGIPPGTVAQSLLKVYSAPPFSAIEPLGNDNLYYVDGHSELLERTVWAICDEAEGVLASRPCDLRFIKTMGERCKVTTLLVNLDRVDPFSGQAIKLFENEAAKAQADGTRVRALILTQPHSPPGRFYPREVLVEYMALCQRLGIHLVVDETYAMTTYASDDLVNPIPFTSVLSIDKTDLIDLDLCHVVHAIGKDLSFFGVKYSILISYHIPLIGAVRTCKPPKTLSIPTALSLCTIVDDADFLSSLLKKRRSRLERHYAICTQFLKKLGIQYRPASAGTAIWVNLSPYMAQQPGDTRNDQRRSLQDSFLRGGVYVSRAGNLQETDESAYFKICFAMDRGALMIGLKRLAKTLNLKDERAETPLNKEEGGKEDPHVADLINKLLAEHDRSPLLRSVGGRGSSDRSNQVGRAAEVEDAASTPTIPPVSRRRRHATVVDESDKIELTSTGAEDTQTHLPETEEEEKTLEL